MLQKSAGCSPTGWRRTGGARSFWSRCGSRPGRGGPSGRLRWRKDGARQRQLAPYRAVRMIGGHLWCLFPAARAIGCSQAAMLRQSAPSARRCRV